MPELPPALRPASAISSARLTRRALAPCPSPARSETAGIPRCSSPADSGRRRARANTVALTILLPQDLERRELGAEVGRIVSGADTNPSGYV